MLVQSHAGEIHLLPALSLAWPDGSFRGLRARGGVEIDLVWKAGRAELAVLRASVADQHAIRANGKVQTVRLREGERRELRLG